MVLSVEFINLYIHNSFNFKQCHIYLGVSVNRRGNEIFVNFDIFSRCRLLCVYCSSKWNWKEAIYKKDSCHDWCGVSNTRTMLFNELQPPLAAVDCKNWELSNPILCDNQACQNFTIELLYYKYNYHFTALSFLKE